MQPAETAPAGSASGDSRLSSSLRGTALTVASMALLALVVLLLIQYTYRPRTGAAAAPPALDTPYQAVLLANGTVFYGKLSRLGTSYPMLTDVYYVRTVADKEKKTTASVLVKRGSEWHGPDRMLISAQQIVLIEPVNPKSQVAELIAASKK